MAFVPLLPEEENNDTSWYKAGAAGIASGIIKVPEGIVSLAAELIDLGLDSDTAASVEQFFDTLNPFEEISEKNGAGKLTEALISIGVPSTIGFKQGSRLAKKFLKARREGTAISAGNKNMVRQTMKADSLNKQAGAIRFGAGVAGGALGETMVADIEEIGSFGDMFDSAPTGLNRLNSEGREDAIRKLMNRFKFGSEGLLLTPFVGAVAKGGKALATKGKELAYSNSKFDRWVNKVAQFVTPEGKLTKELFSSQRALQQMTSSDINRATELVRNLTRSIDSAFPEMQKTLDKTMGPKEKKQFYKDLNELLFDGDLSTGILDPKKSDAALNKLKDLGVTGETSGKIMNALEEARAEFSKLIDITAGKNKGELTDILKDRISKYVGNTYRIFEDKPILGVFNRYKPTDEAMSNAINFFRSQIAKKDINRTTPYDPNGMQYFQEARQIVNNLIDDATKLKKAEGIPNINYINKTLADAPGGKFIEKLMEKTGQPPKVIRELFGEIKDPRLSIFNAVSSLSAIARQTKFLDEVYETNKNLQAAGERGAFWTSREAAREATNGVVPIVKVSETLSGLGKAAGEDIANPLLPLYTTKDIADGLAVANNLKDTFLTSFAKGREGASVAEQGASFLYRNLLLVPKGISQLAKTVLSIPTHIRNVLSAGAFAGANGVLFTNPKDLANAFKEGAQISGLFNLKNFREADLEKAYREMLELGIVNQQIQVGDLKNIFKTARFGEDVGNTDAVLRPMMSRLKAIPKYLQDKYVAEDDFWKVTNYFVEMSRRKKAYAKAGIDTTTDAFQQSLKREAADIVKNTVPNYAFVGDVVRTARILPVGNFMSFPSEIIRTTAGIGQQILKETRHIPGPGEIIRGSNITPMVFIEGKGFVKNNNPMYGIGRMRAIGMATTLTVVPTAVVEGAKALYDVSEDEIQALRQFVPDWSKNSTIVPIKDSETGELKYMDFSHSNAYDLMARPFRTLALSIDNAKENDQTVLAGFSKGLDEAITELASPFVSESIFTEALVDLTTRGGRTQDGRRLYTDQTSFGDRKKIEFTHLLQALAPSYKQGVRLYQTATDTPTRTGELLTGKTLNINDQVLGFMGLRPITVDPVRAMGFKIAEYQRGIREARTEFTGGVFGLLKGGPISQNDIIDRYIASNRARFNVQKEMFKNINAANTLGTDNRALRRQFKDRQISLQAFSKLQQGRFDPYFPSQDIVARFREIARNLGDADSFVLARPDVRNLQQDFRTLDLGSSFADGGRVELANGTDPSMEKGIKSLLSSLRSVRDEMKKLTLDDEFDITLNNFIEPTIPTQPLPPTPGVDPTMIQPAVQQASLTQTGLTPSEQALLSPEEQAIRLRQRGMA
jgi:hypothetical protein